MWRYACLPLGILVMAASLTACTTLQTRAPTGESTQSFEREITRTVSADYLLFLPEDYNETRETYPLMLFLHGAGERGTDINLVAQHGPPKLARAGHEFPFILAAPQCPKEQWWDTNVLIGLLDELTDKYRVDEDRIYVTGLSMGGFATWDLAVTQPHRFAAIAPVCGGGDPEKVDRITHLPTWVFHGDADDVVKLEQSRRMVDALDEAGGNVRFTIYPGVGHDSWTETYNNPELFEWFLEQKRGD